LNNWAGCQWPIILAPQEAEIRRITVQSQRNPILKNPSQKIGLVECLKVKFLSSSPSTEKKKVE
jgi:hypothetical protein